MSASGPNRSATIFLWICGLVIFILAEANAILTFSAMSKAGLHLPTVELWAFAITLCVPAGAGWNGYLLQRRQMAAANDSAVAARFSIQLQSAIIAGYSAVMICLGLLMRLSHR